MTNPAVWFITGVSSGFGRSLAEAALARGDKVVGTVLGAVGFHWATRLEK